MRRPARATATTAAGTTAWVAVMADDAWRAATTSEVEWEQLWVQVEPTAKAIVIAALVWAWHRWVDRDRDGTPDIIQQTRRDDRAGRKL